MGLSTSFYDAYGCERFLAFDLPSAPHSYYTKSTSPTLLHTCSRYPGAEQQSRYLHVTSTIIEGVFKIEQDQD